MAARTPQDVQAALDDLGLDITVEIGELPTATAEEAAAAAGCELGQIVKSLCFMVIDDPVLVLTAGDQKVDTRKISAHFDVGRKKVRMARADLTVEVTGFAPGGVSPFGLANDLPIVIDRSLRRFDIVWVAAGSPKAIFPIPLNTLINVTNGVLLDVVSE